jgi:hypothetical protein
MLLPGLPEAEGTPTSIGTSLRGRHQGGPQEVADVGSVLPSGRGPSCLGRSAVPSLSHRPRDAAHRGEAQGNRGVARSTLPLGWLRWGHGWCAVEDAGQGEPSTTTRIGFNGATAGEPWKIRRAEPERRAGDASFNGATAGEPWKMSTPARPSPGANALQWGHGW